MVVVTRDVKWRGSVSRVGYWQNLPSRSHFVVMDSLTMKRNRGTNISSSLFSRALSRRLSEARHLSATMKMKSIESNDRNL